MEKIKLFCLPCAGGSAIMYSKWNKFFCNKVEVIPVELPGRGSRSNEEFCSSFETLVDDIFIFIKRRILNTEYALLGFSMGGLLVYEVYHKLVGSGENFPFHIFIIARESPKSQTIKINHLSDENFIKEVYSYGGIPDEIYENKELMEFLTPRIRADFDIYEKYVCDVPKLIDVDLSILYCPKDSSICIRGIFDWKYWTTRSCTFYPFYGGHFFIIFQKESVISIIQTVLEQKKD